MTSLREPRYYFRKRVNVHRAISKRKIHSENFIPPLFGVKLSLLHVNLDLTVLACSETTFENKSALIGLRRKQNYSLKTSFVLQNRIERVLSQLGNQLTKMNKVRRSQNHFWKKNT